MKVKQIKTFLAILIGSLTLISISSAQYFDPNYNYNNSFNYSNSGFNSGFGSNPNNGITNFTGGYNFDPYNNNYNNNYNTPISVSGTSFNCINGIYNYNNNCNFNNSYNNYNNYVEPVYTYLTPTTNMATNVRSSNATINGSVAMTGNYSYTSGGTAWFQYGTNQYSLNSSTNPANIFSNTSINSYLTGLNCGTTYYFRAVTRGSGGNSSMQYGNTLSFRTSNCNYSYNYGYNQNYQSTTYYPSSNITTRCNYPTQYRQYWR